MQGRCPRPDPKPAGKSRRYTRSGDVAGRSPGVQGAAATGRPVRSLRHE
ncbi:hypothetical protein LNQ03_03525 [Klebsiella pneumoniae subsp. pneumoniae]|nr:hypothetical protein [Klebsiella pneumoniae subsp. pneumoniae]